MRTNLLRDDWNEQRARPGYAWKRPGLGRALGGELLGTSLYELPPGQAPWPYHWHWANEELLIVVAGVPTLRTPDGERTLQAGELKRLRRSLEPAASVGRVTATGAKRSRHRRNGA